MVLFFISRPEKYCLISRLVSLFDVVGSLPISCLFHAVVAQVFKKAHIEKREDYDKGDADSKRDQLASTGKYLSWIKQLVIRNKYSFN